MQFWVRQTFWAWRQGGVESKHFPRGLKFNLWQDGGNKFKLCQEGVEFKLWPEKVKFKLWQEGVKFNV